MSETQRTRGLPAPSGIERAGRVGLALVALGAGSCGGGAESSPPSVPSAKATPAPGQAPLSGERAAEPTALPATAATAAPGAWPYGPAPSPDDMSALLERLKRDPGPLKSNWVPPGRTERYGHAEGLVAASPDAVRAKLVDFGHYKELAGPKFKTVRVVDKQGKSTDVYFQLPIMKGLVTLWYVTRFPPSRSASAGDVIEGTFVKGNIKNMHIAFTVRPGADESSSVLLCDLVLQPTVPAPQSALDEELRDACGDAVNALRRTLVASP